MPDVRTNVYAWSKYLCNWTWFVVVWVIVRVCSVVLRRTVVGVDWRFDNLSGSHHQSTLMIASAQVVETSVNTNNSPSQDYTTNPDDYSNHNIDSPGFKPFTVIWTWFLISASHNNRDGRSAWGDYPCSREYCKLLEFLLIYYYIFTSYAVGPPFARLGKFE